MWISRKRLEHIENRLDHLDRECKYLNELVFNRVHKDEVYIRLDKPLNHSVHLRNVVVMLMRKIGVKLSYMQRIEPKYILEDMYKKEKSNETAP